MPTLIYASLLVLLIVISYFLVRARREIAALRSDYAPILSVDAEIAKRRNDIAANERTAAADVAARLANADALRGEAARIVEQAQQEKADLVAKYSAGLAEYERLRNEIALLEEQAEDISFGVYRPHFDFHSSEQYTQALERTRDRQREAVRAGQAAICGLSWTVGGSVREGERMAKQNLKMVLRAFNAECDAAIANVTWNNAGKMIERVKKSYDALNKLGTVLNVAVTGEYLELRLDELKLTYEHEMKRQEEKEEQRRIREQIREEERVQRELAKATDEAEKEENRYEKALERARVEAEQATGDKLGKLQGQILKLEADLQSAHEAKARAVSRAQLTKSGYVYIISNPGSLGEQVYKVGMTRRLEPMERIAELGDASVPYPFDVHAMLYSDNAPELERALHEFLDGHRVNLVNSRKEFFTASLNDIEAFAQKRGILVEFTLIAEAREWRESLALRQQARATNEPVHPTFKTELFSDDPADLAVEA